MKMNLITRCNTVQETCEYPTFYYSENTSNIRIVTPNGEQVVVNSAKDLDNLKKEDIWHLMQCLFKNNMSLAKNQHEAVISEHFNEGVSTNKDLEILVLRLELANIAILEKEVAKLKEQNELLSAQVKETTNALSQVKESLSAREIGTRAVMKAVRFVFPSAPRKPYGISTLCGLQSFIKDPHYCEKHCYCLQGAAKAWEALPESAREGVKQRLALLLSKFPNLLFSVRTLKNFWPYAHCITTTEQSIAYFKSIGEDTVVDALTECSIILNNNVQDLLADENFMVAEEIVADVVDSSLECAVPCPSRDTDDECEDSFGFGFYLGF